MNSIPAQFLLSPKVTIRAMVLQVQSPTSSIKLTWEPDRNSQSRAPSQMYRIRNAGQSSATCTLISLPGDTDVHSRLRPTALRAWQRKLASGKNGEAERRHGAQLARARSAARSAPVPRTATCPRGAAWPDAAYSSNSKIS